VQVLNMPVSSTHCKIGAIFFVGFCADGCAKVSWGMLGKIALSWAITLPFAAAVSAAMAALLRNFIEIPQSSASSPYSVWEGG
jgi:phosphate/sulfate permease